ncbi:MAG: hypothetical protein H6Q99_1603 [Proteobacteria bacterium]|nr:hypothetical protein [Pseudomonadota bacterium]
MSALASASGEPAGGQCRNRQERTEEDADQRGVRPADNGGEEGERRYVVCEARRAAPDGRRIAQPEALEEVEAGLADRTTTEFHADKMPQAVRSVAKGAAKPAGPAVDGVIHPVTDLEYTRQVVWAREAADDEVAGFLNGGQGIQADTGVAIAFRQ